VVSEWWSSHSFRGWGGYVLKEKVKGLKQRLKVWNKEKFRDIQKKISRIELELNKLDSDGNGRQLNDREMALRKKLQEDLWLAATSYESLLRQKARTKWIKEGDCNSKFFHITVNRNRRHNALRGLMLDRCWIEEPARIKEEVHQYFRKKFEEEEKERPTLDGISFQTISQSQNDFLIHPFDEKEIKDAMRDCGSHKSPRPDGLNFKIYQSSGK